MSPQCSHRQRLPRLPPSWKYRHVWALKAGVSSKRLAHSALEEVSACFCLPAYEETSLAKDSDDCLGISAVWFWQSGSSCHLKLCFTQSLW